MGGPPEGIADACFIHFPWETGKNNISWASITIMDLLGKAEEVFEDDLLIFDEDES